VVAQHVEAADGLARALPGFMAEHRLLHVARNEQRAAPAGFDVLPRLFGVGLLPGEVDERDIRALAREDQRDGPADAGIAARDERRLALELARRALTFG